ncbi:MAG: GNAT family N-acetyltransferase [Saprospiraceae bacterium]|nr:GNAT family N-acetyltransferase [Saprospiraceae bacterium]
MTFRKATKADVIHIVKMLSDDPLGQQRENYQEPLPEAYFEAFGRIDRDANQELVVIEEATMGIIGTLQLTFIPYLTYQGGVRAQIEAVRIRKDRRGAGIGETVFQWAIERAKARGAHVVQLTTDKKRADAKRFYEKLGFIASHEGMKLHLS